MTGAVWTACRRTAWGPDPAELIHLPVHASWLNQVEIYFSVLQRKAIATGDFTDLDRLNPDGTIRQAA